MGNNIRKYLQLDYFILLIIISSMTMSPWLSFGNRTLYAFHLILVLTLIISKKKIIILFNDIRKSKYRKRLIIALVIMMSSTIINYSNINLKYLFIYLLMSLSFIVILANTNNMDKINFGLQVFQNIIIISVVFGLLEVFTSFRMPYSLYALRDFSKFNSEKIKYLMSYPTVFYFNPNDFAFLLVACYSFVLSRYSSESKSKNYLYTIMLILMIYFTNSRTSLIAVMIVSLSFVLLMLKREHIISFVNRIKKLRKSVLLLISTPIFVGLIYFIKEVVSIAMIVLRGNFSNSPYHSIRERWGLITNSLDVIFQYPLGVGVGNGRNIVATRMNLASADVHNYFLEIGMDFGLIFFLLYSIIFVFVMKQLYKIFRTNTNVTTRNIALGFFLYKISFLVNFIGPSSITYFIPYWFLEMFLFSFLICIHFKNKEVLK